MKYIDMFESFGYKDIILKVDDISAYVPTHTSKVESKWIPNDFDLKKILDDKSFKNYKGSKENYLRYYIFGFRQLSYFFISESDIINRCKSYGLNFFIVNFNNVDRDCKAIFFTAEDWKKLNIPEVIKSINKAGYDILFENDVKIEKDEFDILYEDDDVMAVRPKTYKAAIKYSSDAAWKSALRKNKKWIEKYMTPGSYYGGSNWYRNKTVEKEINSWWRKLLNLPPKKSKVEIKEFFNDFPRYLFYIVIFKRLGITDSMSKFYLLYDVSRSEYGELAKNFTSNNVMFGSYWGDMLDSAHNQVKVVNFDGKRVTLKDIQRRHGEVFNRGFRAIEYNFNKEKEKLYDLLGFWADRGGEYRKDALVFLRSDKNPDELTVTRPNLIEKLPDGSLRWVSLGKYNDKDFEYWDLDEPKIDQKEAPYRGNGFYNGFFGSINNSYLELKDAIDKSDYKM